MVKPRGHRKSSVGDLNIRVTVDFLFSLTSAVNKAFQLLDVCFEMLLPEILKELQFLSNSKQPVWR